MELFKDSKSHMQSSMATIKCAVQQLNTIRYDTIRSLQCSSSVWNNQPTLCGAHPTTQEFNTNDKVIKSASQYSHCLKSSAKQQHNQKDYQSDHNFTCVMLNHAFTCIKSVSFTFCLLHVQWLILEKWEAESEMVLATITVSEQSAKQH